MHVFGMWEPEYLEGTHVDTGRTFKRKAWNPTKDSANHRPAYFTSSWIFYSEIKGEISTCFQSLVKGRFSNSICLHSYFLSLLEVGDSSVRSLILKKGQSCIELTLKLFLLRLFIMFTNYPEHVPLPTHSNLQILIGYKKKHNEWIKE